MCLKIFFLSLELNLYRIDKLRFFWWFQIIQLLLPAIFWWAQKEKEWKESREHWNWFAFFIQNIGNVCSLAFDWKIYAKIYIDNSDINLQSLEDLEETLLLPLVNRRSENGIVCFPTFHFQSLSLSLMFEWWSVSLLMSDDLIQVRLTVQYCIDGQFSILHPLLICSHRLSWWFHTRLELKLCQLWSNTSNDASN